MDPQKFRNPVPDDMMFSVRLPVKLMIYCIEECVTVSQKVKNFEKGVAGSVWYMARVERV